jgi:rRNA processing protein Gar1
MCGRVVSHIGNQVVVEMSSSQVPDLGVVVSAGGKKIGRVFDVIGNVEKPYVIVGLSRNAKQTVVGSQVSWVVRDGR